MPRAVLLLVNRDKPEVLSALPEIRSLIGAHGRLAGEYATGGDDPPDSRGAELIVILGGDGTILGEARRCVDLGLPVVGVKFGNLGFLAEFDPDSLHRHAARLFGDEPLDVRDRVVLRAAIHSGTGPGEREVFRGLAMNDAVVAAGPPYRMIELGMRINGVGGPVIKGDGLIVSTAAGSTAYSVSAGGPILSPELDCFAVTPIAAHSLAFRPVVVPGDSVIELVMRRANDGRPRDQRGGSSPGPGVSGAGEVPFGTALVLDGQVMRPLGTGDRVRLERHDRTIRLVHNPDSVYWRTLMAKLHWAAMPTGENGDRET